jgi:hypothetical protein
METAMAAIKKMKPAALNVFATCLALACLVLMVLALAVLAGGCSRADNRQAAAAVQSAALSVTRPEPAAAAPASAPAQAALETPAQEPVTTADASAQTAVLTSAAQAEVWDGVYRTGSPGKNGGLVYLVEGGDYYEALIPGDTLGADDALPSGWVAPDMEDLGLIYTALQRTGKADYGEWWYFSVSKTGGKNQYFRMSDGTDTTSPAGKARKIGVRMFKDNAPAPAASVQTAATTPAAAPVQTAAPPTPAAKPPEPAKPAATEAAPKYAVGDTGPGGGIVFANAGGKYKEITMPGKEDTFAAKRKREEEHYRPLKEQIEADRKIIDQASAEGDQAKVIKLVDESNARIENYPPLSPYPAVGWRVPSMPELITVYDALKKTGKVNFGNVLYLSSSTVDYRGGGARYTRDAVSYVPGGAETPLGFPSVRFILAGGGVGSIHLMDMGDGAIILVGDELTGGDYPLGRKNFTSGEVRIPYVREF